MFDLNDLEVSLIELVVQGSSEFPKVAVGMSLLLNQQMDPSSGLLDLDSIEGGPDAVVDLDCSLRLLDLQYVNVRGYCCRSRGGRHCKGRKVR